jgi:hypothetical protein
VDSSPAPALPSPPAAERPRWTILRVAAILSVAFTLANATWAAWDQDITYDEFYHLGWPERLLDERVDSRELFRYDSKTPALLPAVLARKAARAGGVESEQALRFTTRLQSIALLALALFLVARLAGAKDAEAFWIGLLLAALDPNLAAHASIATTDVAYALVVLAVALALARSSPTAGSAAWIGALIGISLAVKYTALLLIPVAAAALLLVGGVPPARRLANLALAAACACLVASIFYLGVGVLVPLGSLTLETPLLKAGAAALSWMPLPLPRSVLTGIDASMAHNRPDLWASYIFGEWHPGGVWYYFIAHWLMKTPLALIALVLAGFLRLRKVAWTRTDSWVAILFLIHLAYFSLLFSTQIGLRFALPCVALACALAARGLRGVSPRWLIAGALLAAVERLPYREDPIAFTNLAVWPKGRAYWYTADSNLDYGQNRSRLERFVRESGRSVVIDQATITPGLYVVAANDLTIFPRRRANRWLVENDVPAINIGFTHFAFSITGERFDQYLDAMRTVAPSTATDGACATPLTHYPPGAQIPFEQTTNPGAGRAWLICAVSKKGMDLGLLVTEGRLWFGRVTPQGNCDADLLQENQQSWFRIPREVETRLCVVEIPYRRAFLPYRTAGRLTVRGQGADVELRPIAAERLRVNVPEPD